MTVANSQIADLLIFGGSFDPVHNGHLSMVEHVLRRNLVGHVLVVPASLSPFKRQVSASGEQRLQMLRIGVEGLPPELQEQVDILDIELRRPPPSYTRDTCRALREQFSGKTIALLVGSDSFRDLKLWTDIAEILHHHPVLVFRRLGETDADLRELLESNQREFSSRRPSFFLLDNRHVDCSSTQIREGSHGHCMPDSVREYILHHNLYPT